MSYGLYYFVKKKKKTTIHFKQMDNFHYARGQEVFFSFNNQIVILIFVKNTNNVNLHLQLQDGKRHIY